jgi:hypothetical protein
MFAEIITCKRKRKSAACHTFIAIPLLTRNLFCTGIIKIRGNIVLHPSISHACHAFKKNVYVNLMKNKSIHNKY